MARIFYDDFKFKIFWNSLLCFVFAIPISQFFAVRALLIVLLLSFFIGKRKDSFARFLTLAWDTLLFLLILIVGLLYSEDLPTGFRVIETSLSLLALPLLFSKFESFNKQHLHKIFFAFASGLFVASLICLLNAGYDYYKNGNIEVFFFDKLSEIIDSHPTYLAYYLIAVITFGLYLLYYEKINFSPFVIIVFLSFLFLTLMLTGGLTAFVSMLFILSFFVLKYLLEEKTKRQTLTFGIVALMIICMFVFNSANREDNPLSRKNDYWERLVLWESALKANPDFIFGVGTGDYKTILNEYYFSHDLSKYANSNYNAHNQFIEIFFSNGLIGFIGLLVLLGRPLYLSVRNGNVFGTLIFFPFIIYGMTEVFFGRYQGVVFFALMHQSFITYYQSYQPSFSLKDA